MVDVQLSRHEKEVLEYLKRSGPALASQIGYATCNLLKGESRVKPQGAALAAAASIGRLKNKGMIMDSDGGFLISTKGKSTLEQED